MDKNDTLTPQENKKKHNQTIMTPLVAMAVSFLVVLYVLFYVPGNYLLVAVLSIIFLISAYALGKMLQKEREKNTKQQEENLASLLKSEKASYILLKKALEQMEEINENSKVPAEDIITAQKAIAKVTINRSKENADALMNSNDKVIEKIFDFEENLENTQNQLLSRQKEQMDASLNTIMQEQQKLAAELARLESSMNSGLMQEVSLMQEIKAAQAAEAVQNVRQTQETPQEVWNTVDADIKEDEQPVGFGESTDSAMDIGEDFDFESVLNPEGELNTDSAMDIGEDFDFESVLNPEGELNTDSAMDIGEDFDFNLDLLSDVQVPEAVAESEKEILEPEEEILGLEEEILEPEEEILEPEEEILEPEEEVVEASADMPDLSDPHKLMTPEEIAALIANM